MLKFAVLLALGAVVFRWAMGRWPWEKRVSTRAAAVFRARRLLGVEAGANRNDIISAHKRLVALVHPDRGGTAQQVHEANDARDLLLDDLPHATLEADQENP
jgi:DnaJ homolog subfamily C member 19